MANTSKTNRWLPPVISVSAGLVLWALTSAFWVDPKFLPGPWAVLKAGWQLTTDGRMWEALSVSLTRVIAGYVMGALAGVLTGISLAMMTLVWPSLTWRSAIRTSTRCFLVEVVMG